jgi:hypothetical protein
VKPVYIYPIKTNVSKEMKDKIDNYKKENHISLSDFIRETIEYFFEKKEI